MIGYWPPLLFDNEKIAGYVILLSCFQGVADKISSALDAGFKVIACIGESKQDREAAQRELLLYGQASVLTARVSNWTNLVLAYEPVWATETGEIPDSKEVSSRIISPPALQTIPFSSKR
jgi:hypothetical protein